jgi:hypothetical protein
MLFGQSSPINPVSLRYYIENIHFTKFRADSLTIGTEIIPDANNGASIGESALQFLGIYARHIDGDTVFVGVWGQNIDANQKMISDLGTLKTDSVTSNSGNLKLSGTGTGYVEVTDTLSPATYFTPYQQTVSVAKAGADYTLIQSAINSISDAASDKIYTVLVYPGEYDEAITLKNYVNIVAVDPKATKILRKVTDNNVECHCYLKITIESASGYGLYTQHANTDILVDGDVSRADGNVVRGENGNITINGDVSATAGSGYGVEVVDGTITVNGDISSFGNYSVYIDAGGNIIHNGNVINTYNSASGHGVYIYGTGKYIQHNGTIYCTHADAKAIYAGSAKNVYLMGVYSNRDLHSNITNLISGGFTFDSNVPSP